MPVLHYVIGLACGVAFTVICDGEIIYDGIEPNCGAVGDSLGVLAFECEVVSPVSIMRTDGPLDVVDHIPIPPDGLTLDLGLPVFDVSGRQVGTYGEVTELPPGVYFVGWGRKVVVTR